MSLGIPSVQEDGADMSALRDTSRSNAAPTGATETASYPADAAEPGPAQATRENHRGFGAPASGTWFGRGKNAADTRGVPVTIERHGRGLTVHNLSGGIVDAFGDTAKFWFVPTAIPAPSVGEITAAIAAEADLQARLTALKARESAAAAEVDESRRRSAELLAVASVPAAPARITWAAAGRPDTLVWFGRDIDPGKPLLVTFNDRGNRLYDARTGQQVAHYGSDCPQWYAPGPSRPGRRASHRGPCPGRDR
jgi:hypothetical protein